MDKVCEVGPKTSEIIFKELKRIFLGTKCFWLFPGVGKVLLMSAPKRDILCNYFEHLSVCQHDPDFFLYVSGIWVNTFLNLFRLNFIILPI